jgi:hypothetical protein
MDLSEEQFSISFEQRNIRTVRSLESSNKKVGGNVRTFFVRAKKKFRNEKLRSVNPKSVRHI